MTTMTSTRRSARQQHQQLQQQSQQHYQKQEEHRVEKMAWFMANFQCVDLDDDHFEKIREMLSHCRGSKTRVALSETSGWKSGKNSILQKHKKKLVPMNCIHNMIQDEKFINVLLCVFALNDPNSNDPKLEVVAFKFRSPQDAREMVTCFQAWTNMIPLQGSVNSSVLVPKDTMTTMPGRPTTGSLVASQWEPRRFMSSSVGDLTSSGLFLDTTPRHHGNGGIANHRVQHSGRNWANGVDDSNGSIIFSDTDDMHDGIAIAHVNGGIDNNGRDMAEISSSPVRLVYDRPSTSVSAAFSPSSSSHQRRHQSYHSTTDGVSLIQPGDVQSRSLNRYQYMSTSRSDICSITSNSSRLVPASHVQYRPNASLVRPKFNKNKQYVPRSSGVVGYRVTNSTIDNRSHAGSDWR